MAPVPPCVNPVLSVFSIVALLLAFAASATAQPGMPDLRQMSGVPLPVSDVAVGTVTVRVVRGALTNAVKDQDVELRMGAASRTARTNEAGRAEFTSLNPGVRVRATTTVDGQRLESQEFEVPAAGGVRLMLVAAPPAGAAATPGPSPGGAPVPTQGRRQAAHRRPPAARNPGPSRSAIRPASSSRWVMRR